MNGGILHAVECLSASELSEAQSGYRFFSLGKVADFLSRARKILEADEDLDSYEVQLDQDYATLIPDDSALREHFERIHTSRPAEFTSI
jgi:hypothetical protein